MNTNIQLLFQRTDGKRRYNIVSLVVLNTLGDSLQNSNIGVLPMHVLQSNLDYSTQKDSHLFKPSLPVEGKEDVLGYLSIPASFESGLADLATCCHMGI